MAYTKTNWQDLPNTSTPINATNLNKIENELESVDKSLKYIGNAPSDWNDAKTFGIYHVNGTYTNAPASSHIWGVLIVYENKGGTWTPVTSGSGSWIWQEFRSTSGNIYVRNAINSIGSWSEWKKMITNNIEETTLTLGDYFDTIDINKVTKNGNVVQVVFRGHTKKAITNDTVFATLPYQTKSNNIVALSTMGRYSFGDFIFSYTGVSGNYWKCGPISTDKWVQANFVYITSD